MNLKNNSLVSIIKMLFVFGIRTFGMLIKYIILFYLSSRVLDAKDFGKFSYLFVILNFVYLMVGFGVIDTGMFLIPKKEKENLISAIIFLTCFIGFLFVLVVIVALNIYHYSNILLISMLSIAYIFDLAIRKLSVGLHDKFAMYFYEVISFTLILVLLILFAESLESTIFIYLGMQLLVTFIFLLRWKYSKKNLLENIQYIFKNVKTYGIQVHLSQVLAMGTYDLDKVILESSFGFEQVGQYNFALNFIVPVKLFSTVVAEMFFVEFVKRKRVPKIVILINTLFSIFFSFLFTLIAYFIITKFYTSSYHSILEYIYLLPLLGIFGSLYVPINYFFSAKGLSKQKFINAIVLAGSNIILNSFLVPRFAVPGAMIATIIALIINNLMFFFQYFMFIKKKERSDLNVSNNH